MKLASWILVIRFRKSDFFDDLYKVESALFSKRFGIHWNSYCIFKENIIYSYKKLSGS